jgi:hypothetical protein
LAVVLTTPAHAKNVYLKSGGIIQAKKVWRADGKVYVLATRHTMTSFEPSEVDLKRTFVKRHRVRKRIAAIHPQVQAAAAAPAGAVASQKTADKKAGITIRSLPKLPERPLPSSGGNGTIRQQKKEMAEKIAE